MIDRTTLLERQIPERYVAGRLSAEETAEFEEFLLENPDVIDQVEAARQLKLGLRTLSDNGQLAGLVKQPTVPRLWLAAAGIAAVVLFVALSSVLWRPAPILSATLAGLGDKAGTVAAEYLLVRTRSADVISVMPAGPSQRLLFRLEAPDSRSGSTYRVELLRGEELLSSLDALTLAPDGFLHVYLQTATLGSGEYRFVVKGPAAPSELRFSITSRP